MGLGESAAGGAVFYALIIYGVVALIGLVIYWVVHLHTGRRRPALLSAGAWAALVATVLLAGYFSEDAVEQRREQRQASDLMQAVSAAADVSTEPYDRGGRPSTCTQDGRTTTDGPVGWEATGIGDAGSPDVLSRFATALAQAGFTTSRGLERDSSGFGPEITGRYVLGTRGQASVLVRQAWFEFDTGEYFVVAEDGCADLDPRR